MVYGSLGDGERCGDLHIMVQPTNNKKSGEYIFKGLWLLHIITTQTPAKQSFS